MHNFMKLEHGLPWRPWRLNSTQLWSYVQRRRPRLGHGPASSNSFCFASVEGVGKIQVELTLKQSSVEAGEGETRAGRE